MVARMMATKYLSPIYLWWLGRSAVQAGLNSLPLHPVGKYEQHAI